MLVNKFLKNSWYFCCNIFERFWNEGGISQAAGLSYVTLLSLVPLMTVSLSVLAAFPIFKDIGTDVQSFIFKIFVASSAEIVQKQLQVFMAHTAQLSVAGIIFLLITAVMMIVSIEQAFNKIWKVRKQRNIIQAVLMYWAVLTLAPILIGSGILLSSYVMGITFVAKATALFGIKKIGLFVAPYVLTFAAFLLLYIAVPNCKVKFKSAAIGAIVATTLFEVVKHGFAFYIANFPTYRLIYGALAAIPIFLVWLYLSWLVILFGALVSYAIGNEIVIKK